MKLPSEPSQIRLRGSVPGTKKPSEVEPPKEPFINLSNTGPVDPARFQRFIVPMEFIEKANELDWSQMEEEGELQLGIEQTPNVAAVDAESHEAPPRPGSGLPEADAEDEVTPACTKTPSVEPPSPLLPDARVDAHEPLTPPEATRLPEQATTQVVPRRPVGVIARWRLSRKMPMSMRVAVAAVVALACILIWSYTHLEAGEPRTVKPVSTALVRPTTLAAVATTPIGDRAVAESINHTEPPGAVKSPPGPSAHTVPNKTPRVTKRRDERPTVNANAVAPAPSASAPIKGVIPVIEPE